MPMPTRRPSEGHDDFVSRCMGDSVMVAEFDDPGQRRAVCESIWTGGRSRAMKRTHLDVEFELKALDEDGTFTGYGSVFDVIDSYNERVAPGAFKRSLASWKRKGRMPALLWQHNTDQPIGVYTKMREDKTGLLVDGQLALRTARGAEAYELMKMEAVSGLSIGFTTVKSEYDDKKGIRTLTEIDLWETSIVTFPANEEARIDAVKSVREWERLLMRDAGLSRSEALIVIHDGVNALLAKRDAGDGLAELNAIVDRTAQVLTSRGVR